MSRREHVKPVLWAFLHAKSADLLFLNNHKIPWLMYIISHCLFQSELGLNQLQRTKISKKNFVFEVRISNQPFFCADPGSAEKIPTNAYFGHQRATKLSQRELQTFKLPYLFHFWRDCFFLLWRPFIGSIIASD